MASIDELRRFFTDLDRKVVIAADGETRTHRRKGDEIVEQMPAGGVSVAFDVLCQASGATYITRGKTEEDRAVLDPAGCVAIQGDAGEYMLKRIFLTPEEEEAYYAGFSNQTLWPLCHIAFQRPIFRRDWFDGYREVNRRFAESVQDEIGDRTFVWLNDYQLALAPSFIKKREDTVVGLFWHIPWPTWEIFRIMPYKREILESLLHCDFIAFHRRYQARNFLNAIDRELGARIDFETNTVHHDGATLRVASLPLGIDVDLIRESVMPAEPRTTFFDTLRSALGLSMDDDNELASPLSDELHDVCLSHHVLLGVDRLDYTKGIPERLNAIDRFYELNPEYRGQTVYVGIMSPTRVAVPAYKDLADEVRTRADEINARYRTDDWEPLWLVWEGAPRESVLELYTRAAVCLVTPLDDGMNLVSKEFVVAASTVDEPGMLVLSQFAGSAIDLTASILVNPYDRDEVAEGIKAALEMDPADRKERIGHMVELLEDRNVYTWAMTFIRNAVTAAWEQQVDVLPVL